MPGRLLYWYTIALLPFIAWSGFGAKRFDLWFAETLPILIGYAILWRGHRSFPLTHLNYLLVFSGSLLMLVGSYYSYSLVPLFDDLKALFNLERNPFDKLVHFYQGVVVAMLSREVLIRRVRIFSRRWADSLALIVAAALAGAWEVIEWIFVVLVSWQGVAEPGHGFLGQQNDPWDAQSDMFFAFVGAGFAILLLRGLHDRQVSALQSGPAQPGAG